MLIDFATISLIFKKLVLIFVVGESTQVADSMTECVKSSQDSAAASTCDPVDVPDVGITNALDVVIQDSAAVGTHDLTDLGNEESMDVKMTEAKADKVKDQSEEPNDTDEKWVVLDEANEEENSEFTNSAPAEGSKAKTPDIIGMWNKCCINCK